MKLNKFLLSAIAAASLTACSDSPEIVDNNKGHWNADGTGYVSLSISMPDNVGSKGGRASNNDDFVKGDDNEYAVKNATLVIFTGNGGNESTYTLQAAYDLPIKFQTIGGLGDQVISTAKITKKINEKPNTEAKALVILNKPQKLELSGDDLTFEEEDGSKHSCIGKTFAEFQALQTGLNTNVADGFTMTNAPLTNAYSTSSGLMPSSGRTTTTLAKITTGNIKPTAEEAAQNPAATIYVERSVAKVTVKSSMPSNFTIENTHVKCEIDGFALDNTNNTSYIVRKVDNNWANYVSQSSSVNDYSDKYRFVGYNNPIETSLYRTYWAEDPNYTTDLTPSTEATSFKPIGDDSPLYCMENTFSVEKQLQKNTTRAIVKVQMWKDDADKGKTYYMYNNDASTFDLVDNIKEKIKAAANNIAEVVASKKEINDIEIDDIKDASDNVIGKKITSVTFTDGTPVSNDLFNRIKNYFGDITVYPNGFAYYPVLIKHFGDRLTPWNLDDPRNEWTGTRPAAGNVETIYPANNRDNNYLGRYGVVRNNWYEINVSKVLRPGQPTIDTPDDTPDDELNNYISVSINILSWAKRSQNVDLQ